MGFIFCPVGYYNQQSLQTYETSFSSVLRKRRYFLFQLQFTKSRDYAIVMLHQNVGYFHHEGVSGRRDVACNVTTACPNTIWLKPHSFPLRPTAEAVG